MSESRRKVTYHFVKENVAILCQLDVTSATDQPDLYENTTE